jgi:Fe-Mn family superoxide dismutase
MRSTSSGIPSDFVIIETGGTKPVAKQTNNHQAKLLRYKDLDDRYSKEIMTTKQILSPVLRAASIHVRSSVLPASLSQSSAAHFASAAPGGGKAVLPDLPYDYAALSPVISAETMELHHTKHHNAYVTNLNIALEKLNDATSAGDVNAIIALQGALKFNGGGHLNHTLFWENLCSKGSSTFPTTGPLADAMVARFCTVENMKKEISTLCVGVQGSGWGWLGYNQSTGENLLLCRTILTSVWQYISTSL